MIQPFNEAISATKMDKATENPRSRASKNAPIASYKEVRDRKRSRLLWKGERKFPDQNDGRLHENRKRAVLKFTREIAADPGIRTQDWPMTLGPTARHVGEHWQHRQFVIVIPKKRADCARAISGRRQRRVIRLKARR